MGKHIQMTALISNLDESSLTMGDMERFVDAFCETLGELGMEAFSITTLEPDAPPWNDYKWMGFLGYLNTWLEWIAWNVYRRLRR